MSEPGGVWARGRGRGRGRGLNQQVPDAVQLPQLQGVWARRPGPAQPQPQPPPVVQPIAGPSRSQPQGVRPPLPGGIGRGRRGAARDNPVDDGVARQIGDLEIRENGAAVGRGATRKKCDNPPQSTAVLPQRSVSKQGTDGDQILLQANYFELLSMPDWCLYLYQVNFAPDEDRTHVRKALLRPHRDTLGPYIFNGSVLYTRNRLPEKMELFSTRQSDEAAIRIDIKQVGDLMKGDYHYLQFFNIIMRKCLEHLNLQLVGRDYYDALAKIEIRDYQLELWPGYFTSIRQHERGILMCAEISHKVMRQQTLYHILDDCRRNNRDGDPRRQFAHKVIGQVVLTGYNNNTYRIDDVDFDVTPQSTFQLRNGESISYMDYYRNKYQINIRIPTQPMLVSKSKPRERRAGQAELVYLVPELCRSTGMTDDMRSNWQLMKALADHTRVGPSSRMQKLLQFNNRLRSVPAVVTDLKDWNFKLSNDLVTIPARVMKQEKIIFANNQVCEAGHDADWTRNLRKVQMLSCQKLQNWALIVPGRAKRDVESWLQTLSQVASALGFSVSPPQVYEINDDKSITYTNTIEKIMSRVRMQLIFCVVPNNRPERYSAIKKKCCIDRPVPSQVFLAKNLTNKGVASIATKVAIQMNCKIGGVPWTVDIPLRGLMVAGFDVCHDTANKGHDFGALVVSLNDTFSRYFSAVSRHTQGEELSNDLSTNMCKAVHAYKTLNGALPQMIIVYRDGVGEGQIPYVKAHEVEHLKTRLAQLYGNQKVRMAFIIVTKRLNTRLFYQKRNPPPGTVVDDVITDPTKYDFFIVSQSVRQGSVSPSSFSVISDTSGLNANMIQRLTYKLTHMYFNWSGTVRVPAPCQYAHKLAIFVSQNIHSSPSVVLETTMYFL